MEILRIVKGGKLRRRYWDYDEAAEKGRYRWRDVTELLPRKLYDECDLQKGLTLRDVFLLLQKHIQFCEMTIGNWVEEIVEEGLSNPLPDDFKMDMSYLECYWSWEEDKHEKTIGGYYFPGFHGQDLSPDAECQNIGVSLTPVNELMPYELKLRKMVTISPGHKETMKALDAHKPVKHRERKGGYTLGHILYSIIWELSFHGGPKEREEFKEMLQGRIDRVKSGEEKLYSMEIGEDGELTWTELPPREAQEIIDSSEG